MVEKIKRVDGRKADELRPVKITAGVIKEADGSAFIEWGQNKIYAAVHGPREVIPKHMSNPYKAILRYTYRMACFSVSERKNPRPGRRDMEISKVSAEALDKSVFLEKFPNSAIDVFVYVMDSNAGTRAAALTAASVALADAGIPLRGLVSSVSVGRANGNLIVDLNKEEEDVEDAVDLALAFLPATEELVLHQSDGLHSVEEWKKMYDLGLNASKKIHEVQKQALRERYVGENNE
ncbi:MAG: exosome complex exonuclease Rrp41 [archaeon]